jgi:hypothetical protein
MRLSALLVAGMLAGCSSGGSAPTGNNVIAASPDAPSAPTPPPTGPAGPCVAPLPPGGEANCDFGAQERLQGVWVRGFEQSAFLPGETTAPGGDYATRDHFWLTFADGVELDPAAREDLNKVPGTSAAAIEFIGRRSRAVGGSPVVIVDRIISVRALGEVGAR